MSDVLRRGRHVPIHGQIAQEQLHLFRSREQVFPRTHPVKADVALRGLSPHQVTPMSGAHPLPPANSRRPFCFRWLSEAGCSLASSGLRFPAAVAEEGRWCSG